MKIKVSPKAIQGGSALLIALILCAILSMSVMYYMSLAEQQNYLSMRSQTWNTAISVAEAGIEEGLQHLNNNTANLAADGWSGNASVYTSPTRTLPDGNSYVVEVNLSIDPFHPTVTANAAVTAPRFAQNVIYSPVLAAIGATSSTDVSVSRAVRVHCARGNLLIKGMVAKHLIDMKGNDILTDSFDSSDPAFSTAGRYDNTKTKDNGDVATNERLANSVGVGNANIYGHVIVGPGGTVAVNTQGGVGTHAWQASNPGKIQPGYFADNANFTFPNTFLPYTSALPPTSGDVTVTNFTLSSTVTYSATYPNPVPYGGVRTNVSYITTSSWPNMPGTVTNCSLSLTKNKYFPAAGTYCGTPWQGGNDNNWWSYYMINGYTYPKTNYSYNLYSTNYTVSTTHFDNILQSGDYAVNTLQGKTLVLGQARLVALNGINMTGSDVLQIAQTGYVEIYVAGTSSTLGGNGVLNLSGLAENCKVYFTSTVKNLTLNGNGETIAVFVAPEADVVMNGGGYSVNDFIGCLMASSITMNGHFQFHYDEALGKRGANSRWIVTAWDEL